MNDLDQAWAWYRSTLSLLRLTRRLAEKHWDSLDWEGELGRDDQLKEILSPVILEKYQLSRSHFDDLSVVALFSAFEASVRGRIASEVAAEAATITHPVL